ncbi:ABC transporter permease subunit [Leptotrichia sp. OH3620_COT-345]|uniref:ABC transporter substrate-binding protein/permease n=1 Tax=Leptotrichia sp. OH3620_COT-345 TaxID=2491048 RepID=UPI000F64C730|nr:ABC transporter substrate-binding protein/permease [Leptotrichia sp. OH3620_COT-345]RRD39537.1 ABC transporter permease subunit [Leptotrichia sp. OH3620_COT-345]
MKLNKIKNKIVLLLIFLTVFVGGYAQNGELKVGMECGYAPFNWFQNTGKNDAVKIEGGYCGGYDVEIAKLIAEGLGKKLVIVKSEWDALLGPALTSGKVDIVIAGMSPTIERKESLSFTKPYYESDLVVVVAKDGKYTTAKSINDFQGARITGQLSTLHYNVINQMKGVSKQPAMENFPAMIVALSSGKIDGYVSEKPGAMAAQLSNPNLTFIEFDKENGFEYENSEVDVAIGIKKGNEELVQKINEILDEISSEKRKSIMETAIKNQPEMEQRSFTEWVLFFLRNNWGAFLKGTLTTLLVSLTGTIVGFIIGLGVILVKNINTDERTPKLKKIGLKILNTFFSIYVTVFRGTPMIVQSMVIYYGSSQVFNWNFSPMGAALFIVSINTGAYMCEIIRGGIDSIDKGQFEAAQAIGMTHFQMMKNIIFPQMFRIILPAIGNEFIINIKDTSVLNVISVTELFFISKSVAGSYSRYYEVFIITSVIYFFLTFTLSSILKYIEKKIDGPQNFEFLDEISTKDTTQGIITGGDK